MSFDEDLSRKIAARESGLSPMASLRAAQQADAERRAGPLLAAVRGMLARMEESPAFRRMMGAGLVPEVAHSDIGRPAASVTVQGTAANLVFRQSERLLSSERHLGDETRLTVVVHDGGLRDTLGLVFTYGDEHAPTGSAEDVEDFVAACEDFVAEFLADVAVTAYGRELLAAPEPSPALGGPVPGEAAVVPATGTTPVPGPRFGSRHGWWTRRNLVHLLSWLRPSGSRPARH